MSKLKRMSIGNNPMVYYDTVVYDYNNRICFLSIIDKHDDLKKLKKELRKKNNIYLVEDRRYVASDGENNDYLMKKQAKSDFAQLIVYKKDNNEDKDNKTISIYLYKKDTEELKNLLYDKLYKYSSIPILEEWGEYLCEKLTKAGFLYQLDISTIYDIAPFEPYRLIIQENALLQIIQNGLRNKEISINNCSKTSDLMDSVNGLDSYLNIFGEILAGKIQQSFTPKFDPNKDEYDTWVNYYDDSCYHAGIELYNAQKACIQSSVNNLKVNKATFVIAEMGSGSYNVSRETFAVLG